MNVEVQRDGHGIFIVADGVRIAKRERGGAWIPLIPAWIVTTARARRVAKWLANEVDGSGPSVGAPVWPDGYAIFPYHPGDKPAVALAMERIRRSRA
jgi:hypothetical protein